jgi:cysteine-S-conjugate beta-lyase
MSARFDDIPIETLRELGAVKWTQFPGKVGAFIAEMDFGIAPPITRALHAAVDQGSFGYLPQALVERLAEAYADWSRTRYGWDIPPANVRPLADVIAGLIAAIEHFSRPGSPVIVPTPAYMPFLVVPRTLGREVIEVPLVSGRDGRLSYDLDGLDAAFRAGGHLLIVCNPHNPVGRVLTRAEMTGIAEVVERHGGRVFADEIHAPLVFPGHRHVPYASISPVAAGHALTATSASKAWNLPGLKCAQLILSNDADLQAWSTVGFMAEHGASNLGVVANIAAFSAGGPWLDEVIAYLDGSRALLGELLAEHLPGVGYAPPEGTYLAWLDCRELDLGDQPCQYFLDRAGVALTDGRLCGAVGTGFARYNFATPRPIMRESVERMARALAAR